MSQMAKPDWLRIRPPTEKFYELNETIKKNNQHTVCQESHCPNMSECWSGGTATFMIMGDTCTRACKFCAVKTAFPPKKLDLKEPENLAKTVKEMGLDYVVITSVDRDDLSDQGAGHFAECIAELKKQLPVVLIEVLIPDFRGETELIQKVIDAKPDVIAHNIETVKSLQKKVRDPRANYDQSMKVLSYVKESDPKIYTKSSMMLGLGEKDEEVIETMEELHLIGVSVITFGQYLRPSEWHLEIKEYIHPDKFEYFKNIGKDMGFEYIASGPFVRSSYKAGELFMKNIMMKQR